MSSTNHDDPNAQPTALVVILFTVLFIATVFGLQAYFGRVKDQEEARKVFDQAPLELEALQAAQRTEISEYRWADQSAGVVAIPIERAMKLVSDEMARGTSSTPQATTEAN